MLPVLLALLNQTEAQNGRHRGVEPPDIADT